MPKKFTLLIDESGDQGLDRVMTHEKPFGASSYLTMGAVLVPTSYMDDYRNRVFEMRKSLDVSTLHCTDMSHAQVSYFAREVSKLRVLSFGVISKKSTLGSYKAMIAGEDQAQDFYNKCAQYLFELVGHYIGLQRWTASEVAIVFEKKRGHDYARLYRYLKKIGEKPIDPRAAKLLNLFPNVIDAKTKEDEPLLAVADCIAYSLHRAFCSENNKLKLTEQRYLRELKPKFSKCERTGQIANHGIKFIKGPIAMGLKGSDLKFAQKFYEKSSEVAKD
ncbi:Protein of unknown function [Ruegeria lacuscaerulensis ITI-1157]|nr:Protein of unknown function [Ruegeria lacuscaerulensis ITI-1157]